MSIHNPESVEFRQCHAKGHFIYHINKDNERGLCQDLLTIENTDSDLKVQALHYANDLLVRGRHFFQKVFANSLNLQKHSKESQTGKNCNKTTM